MTDQPASAPPTPFGEFGIAPAVAPRRRSRLAWLGPVLIVGGLVGAAATFVAQRLNYQRRVEGLERAVSGYTTTLTFERAGAFTFYYEYEGRFRASFDGSEEELTISAPERRPTFAAVLRDDTGAEVDLSPATEDVTYDAAGFKGRTYRQAQIPAPGDFTLEVTPEAGTKEFALAIGIGTITRPSIALPAAIAALGVVAGGLLVLAGRRRRRTPIGDAATGRPAPPVAAGPPPSPIPSAAPAPGWGTSTGWGTAPGTPAPPPVSTPPGPTPPGPIGSPPAPSPGVPPMPRPLPPPTWAPPSPPSS